MKRLLIYAAALVFIPACAQMPIARQDNATALSLGAKLIGAATPISDDDEIALGREVAANLLARFGHYDDYAVTRYVNLVGQTLERRAARRNIRYHFAILDSETVNAFAAPGGYIFVTKGALKLMADESELAAALAHEIAHVSSRHIAKEIQKANLVGAGADVVSMLAKDKAKSAALTGFSTDILFKGYSRKDEDEADRLACDYLETTGYDIAGFKNFLERLSSQKHDEPKLMVFFSTHPRPED
ncbi:MAG: M48 family metalloprotease, partial [Endomicrobiia bacterium]|nr:M48 family metalloprotease [Endomicrobiia bacterium]